MSNHTPGPWKYHREENAMREFRGFSVTVPANKRGGRVVLIPPECIEDEADARLIAAAPDLLAALEGLIRLEPATTTAQGAAPHNVARAAIAQAKGES